MRAELKSVVTRRIASVLFVAGFLRRSRLLENPPRATKYELNDQPSLLCRPALLYVVFVALASCATSGDFRPLKAIVFSQFLPVLNVS